MSQDDRTQVETLSRGVQQVTGENVTLAYVAQGYSGENAKEQVQKCGIELFVVKLEETKRDFVLLLKRRVVECSFAWATRCQRLAKDYERLPETLAGPTSSLLFASCSNSVSS